MQGNDRVTLLTKEMQDHHLPTKKMMQDHQIVDGAKKIYQE